jgi:hypothetical protein
LPAVSVARHDADLVGAGPHRHAGGAEVAARLPAGQQHLADGDAVPVQRQHPALPVQRHIEVAVGVGAHGIRRRAGEVIGNGRAEGRDCRRVRQLDPVQEVPAELRGPQHPAVRAERDTVRHGEARQHGRNAPVIRRDVKDTADRIGRGAPEVGEVAAATHVEDQVVRREAGVRRDDCPHPRAVGLDREDATQGSADVQGCDEDAPVPVDGDATGTESPGTGHDSELPVRPQAKDAPAGHVAEQQIAGPVEGWSLEHQSFVGYLEPGLRHHGLQGTLGGRDRHRSARLRVVSQRGPGPATLLRRASEVTLTPRSAADRRRRLLSVPGRSGFRPGRLAAMPSGEGPPWPRIKAPSSRHPR